MKRLGSPRRGPSLLMASRQPTCRPGNTASMSRARPRSMWRSTGSHTIDAEEALESKLDSLLTAFCEPANNAPQRWLPDLLRCVARCLPANPSLVFFWPFLVLAHYTQRKYSHNASRIGPIFQELVVRVCPNRPLGDFSSDPSLFKRLRRGGLMGRHPALGPPLGNDPTPSASRGHQHHHLVLPLYERA